MPGIQSEVQCVPTLDLGKFQGLLAVLSGVYVYHAHTRIYEFTYALDVRDGNHRCAPGSTLTCSCTGPPVNFWSAPATSSAIRSSSPPSPICWPLRKASDKVEDRSSHPLTFRRLALAPASFISLPRPRLFFLFFSFLLRITIRRIPAMCRIELDVRADTTFTIGGRLSYGDNKIKKSGSASRDGSFRPDGRLHFTPGTYE